ARTVSPRTSYDTCVDVVFVALSTAPVGDLWTPRERRLRSRRTAAACGRGVTTLRYVLRRLGFYWVAAWVSLSLNFVLPRLMPGDPASAMMARFRGQLSPDALDALRAAFGISDAPLYRQYFEYVGHLLTGNMGASIRSEERRVGKEWRSRRASWQVRAKRGRTTSSTDRQP